MMRPPHTTHEGGAVTAEWYSDSSGSPSTHVTVSPPSGPAGRNGPGGPGGSGPEAWAAVGLPAPGESGSTQGRGRPSWSWWWIAQLPRLSGPCGRALTSQPTQAGRHRNGLGDGPSAIGSSDHQDPVPGLCGRLPKSDLWSALECSRLKLRV